MAVPFSNTKLRVPRGFQNLLEGLAKEVLRNQPENINAFAAVYFGNLLKIREEQGIDPAEIGAKHEDRFYNNKAFSKAGNIGDVSDPQQQEAATTIQAAVRGHQAREEISEEKADKEKSAEDEAAVKIQAAYRGYEARKRVNLLKDGEQGEESRTEGPAEEIDIDLNDPEVEKAATMIQKSYRGFHVRKTLHTDKDKPPEDSEPPGEVTSEESPPEATHPAEETTTSEEKPKEDGAATETEEKEKEEEIDIDLTDPEVEKAALKIQGGFRGLKVRKEMKEMKEKDAAGKEEDVTETEEKSEEKVEVTEENAAEEEIDIDLNDPEVGKAALKIQAGFRGYKDRKNLKSDEEGNLQTVTSQSQTESSQVVQTIADSNEMFSHIDASDPEVNLAASKIQAGFKGMKVRNQMHCLLDSVDSLDVKLPMSPKESLVVKSDSVYSSAVSSFVLKGDTASVDVDSETIVTVKEILEEIVARVEELVRADEESIKEQGSMKGEEVKDHTTGTEELREAYMKVDEESAVEVMVDNVQQREPVLGVETVTTDDGHVKEEGTEMQVEVEVTDTLEGRDHFVQETVEEGDVSVGGTKIEEGDGSVDGTKIEEGAISVDGTKMEEGDGSVDGTKIEEGDISVSGTKIEEGDISVDGTKIEEGDISVDGTKIEVGDISVDGTKIEEGDISEDGTKIEDGDISNDSKKMESQKSSFSFLKEIVSYIADKVSSVGGMEQREGSESLVRVRKSKVEITESAGITEKTYTIDNSQEEELELRRSDVVMRGSAKTESKHDTMDKGERKSETDGEPVSEATQDVTSALDGTKEVIPKSDVISTEDVAVIKTEIECKHDTINVEDVTTKTSHMELKDDALDEKFAEETGIALESGNIDGADEGDETLEVEETKDNYVEKEEVRVGVSKTEFKDDDVDRNDVESQEIKSPRDITDAGNVGGEILKSKSKDDFLVKEEKAHEISEVEVKDSAVDEKDIRATGMKGGSDAIGREDVGDEISDDVGGLVSEIEVREDSCDGENMRDKTAVMEIEAETVFQKNSEVTEIEITADVITTDAELQEQDKVKSKVGEEDIGQKGSEIEKHVSIDKEDGVIATLAIKDKGSNIDSKVVTETESGFKGESDTIGREDIGRGTSEIEGKEDSSDKGDVREKMSVMEMKSEIVDLKDTEGGESEIKGEGTVTEKSVSGDTESEENSNGGIIPKEVVGDRDIETERKKDTIHDQSLSDRELEKEDSDVKIGVGDEEAKIGSEEDIHHGEVVEDGKSEVAHKEDTVVKSEVWDRESEKEGNKSTIDIEGKGNTETEIVKSDTIDKKDVMGAASQIESKDGSMDREDMEEAEFEKEDKEDRTEKEGVGERGSGEEDRERATGKDTVREVTSEAGSKQYTKVEETLDKELEKVDSIVKEVNSGSKSEIQDKDNSVNGEDARHKESEVEGMYYVKGREDVGNGTEVKDDKVITEDERDLESQRQDKAKTDIDEEDVGYEESDIEKEFSLDKKNEEIGTLAVEDKDSNVRKYGVPDQQPENEVMDISTGEGDQHRDEEAGKESGDADGEVLTDRKGMKLEVTETAQIDKIDMKAEEAGNEVEGIALERSMPLEEIEASTGNGNNVSSTSTTGDEVNVSESVTGTRSDSGGDENEGDVEVLHEDAKGRGLDGEEAAESKPTAEGMSMDESIDMKDGGGKVDSKSECKDGIAEEVTVAYDEEKDLEDSVSDEAKIKDGEINGEKEKVGDMDDTQKLTNGESKVKDTGKLENGENLLGEGKDETVERSVVDDEGEDIVQAERLERKESTAIDVGMHSEVNAIGQDNTDEIVSETVGGMAQRSEGGNEKTEMCEQVDEKGHENKLALVDHSEKGKMLSEDAAGDVQEQTGSDGFKDDELMHKENNINRETNDDADEGGEMKDVKEGVPDDKGDEDAGKEEEDTKQEAQTKDGEEKEDTKPKEEEEIDIDLNDPEVEQAAIKIQAGFKNMMSNKKKTEEGDTANDATGAEGEGKKMSEESPAKADEQEQPSAHPDEGEPAAKEDAPAVIEEAAADTAPADATGDDVPEGAPAEDGNEPKNDEDGAVPSTEEDGKAAPPEEGEKEAPTGEDEKVAPTEGDGTVAPTEGDGTVAPADEDEKVAPTEEDGKEAPAEEDGQVDEKTAASADETPAEAETVPTEETGGEEGTEEKPNDA